MHATETVLHTMETFLRDSMPATHLANQVAVGEEDWAGLLVCFDPHLEVAARTGD